MAGAAKRVLVPCGNGTEEMEAVIIVDVLRRAGAEGARARRGRARGARGRPSRVLGALRVLQRVLRGRGFDARPLSYARPMRARAAPRAPVVVASVEDSLQVKCR
jgi:putative intracellular protease/amidase